MFPTSSFPKSTENGIPRNTSQNVCNLVKIAALTRSSSCFRLLAKVLSKSEIQSDSSQKIHFNFIFEDDSGIIRGKVEDNECHRIFPQLEIGRTYAIMNAIMGTNVAPNGGDNRVIILNAQTILEEIPLRICATNRNLCYYGPLKVVEILGLSNGDSIDFIGKIRTINELEEVKISNGSVLLMRRIDMIDEDQVEISIVFWNETAIESITQVQVDQIVLMKNVQIHVYKSESKLYFTSNSRLFTAFLVDTFAR